MTREEILEAISEDKIMPFVQPEQLAGIVDFVIKNYTPSIPSDLDEAARRYVTLPNALGIRTFKAGAEWMAGQGVTKEAVIGMATEEIFIKVSGQTLDELDLRPGDKFVAQIRKK